MSLLINPRSTRALPSFLPVSFCFASPSCSCSSVIAPAATRTSPILIFLRPTLSRILRKSSSLFFSFHSMSFSVIPCYSLSFSVYFLYIHTITQIPKVHYITVFSQFKHFVHILPAFFIIFYKNPDLNLWISTIFAQTT